MTRRHQSCGVWGFWQREPRRCGYFPLSVSLTLPTAFWIFPATLSALQTLVWHHQAPCLATSLVLPLISFADPSSRSLSMSFFCKTKQSLTGRGGNGIAQFPFGLEVQIADDQATV
jgi:hypothetical protein